MPWTTSRFVFPLVVVVASWLAFTLGLRSGDVPALVPPKASESKLPETGVAVVELFTSEGCSSCPPADAVLKDMEAKYRGKNVHFIAAHVDYWDRLGWPDRFASKERTERQQGYADAFLTRSIYTPQMVVNGQVEFVGSDRGKAEKAIDAGLRSPSTIKMTATLAERKTGEAVEVHVTASATAAAKLEGKLIAHVVWTEDDLVSKVVRGENAGRTLEHTHVARAWTSGQLNAKGEVELRLQPPERSKSDASRIEVFLQRERNGKLGEIVAATSLPLK